MEESLVVCGKRYPILRLLGHGKGGYSYLAEQEGQSVVLKQIHHEPCAYYTFGNKIEAECRDYQDNWSFDAWGVKYWTRTPELEAYLEQVVSDS